MDNPQQLCLLLCFVIAFQKEHSQSVTTAVVSVLVSLPCYLLYRIWALSLPSPILPPLLCCPFCCHVQVLTAS